MQALTFSPSRQSDPQIQIPNTQVGEEQLSYHLLLSLSWQVQEGA